MATKYETLLEKLEKFKAEKGSKASGGKATTAKSSTLQNATAAGQVQKEIRRSTILSKQNTTYVKENTSNNLPSNVTTTTLTAQSRMGTKRKNPAALATSGPKSKQQKLQDNEEMRKKLEEWRKKSENPKEPANKTERRRTFFPTGPYGVSFGVDMGPAKTSTGNKAASQPLASRKSLPASRQNLLVSRKSLPASRQSLAASHKSLAQKSIPTTTGRKSLLPSRKSPSGARKSILLSQKTSNLRKSPRNSTSRQSLLGKKCLITNLAAHKLPRKSLAANQNARLQSRKSLSATQKSVLTVKNGVAASAGISTVGQTASMPTYDRVKLPPQPTPKRVPAKKKEISVNTTPQRILNKTNKISVNKTPLRVVKEEPKKKKIKFVASRIDTGLKQLKRSAPVKPKPAPALIKTSTLDNRPAWNFTPKVSSTVSKISFLHDSDKERLAKIPTLLFDIENAELPETEQKKRGDRRSILRSQNSDVQDGRVRFADVSMDEDKPQEDKQKEMRGHLNSWLKEQGKTPSKYSTLLGKNNSRKTMVLSKDHTVREEREEEEEDETEEEKEDPVFSKLQQLLSECFLLLDTGCPSESVQLWMDEVVKETGLEAAQRCAKYWICRARLEELSPTAQHSSHVLDVYEQASRQPNLKNPEELADALKQYVTRLRTSSSKEPSTPANKPPRPNISTPCPFTPSNPPPRSDAIFTIKYSMMQPATPFFKRLRSEVSNTGGSVVDGVVTPVRRSTRLRRSFLPDYSKPDDEQVVDDLSELPDDLHLLYKENMALHMGDMDEEEEEEV